jgi:hypothetical protein
MQQISPNQPFIGSDPAGIQTAVSLRSITRTEEQTIRTFCQVTPTGVNNALPHFEAGECGRKRWRV